jgi:hypothetical protein
MLGDVMDSLARPSNSMSWAQLAAATVFVLVVMVGWRQITFYIMREM